MAKRPAQQIPIIPGLARGGGGGSPASLAQMAVGSFINDQNTAQKKMLNNFAKLQEAQAMEASQNAGQTTQAMNQIVAREDKRKVREESLQDRMEDRQYKERFSEWTAKRQTKAAKDFAATQQRVATQMAAGRDFIQRMDVSRRDLGVRIRGMRLKLNDPGTAEQWINTPGGEKRLVQMRRLLKVAEYQHEQDNQSDYTGWVAQEMGKVSEQIPAGEPYRDLTELYGKKPKDLMAKGPPSDNLTTDWSDDEVEELFHTGGYPPGGLYGRDPDDPSMAKYQNFNVMDYMTQMRLLEDEQAFSLIQHKKGQDDWLAMRMESARELRDSLGKIQEFNQKSYKSMEPIAVQAITEGASDFANDLGTGRITVNTLSQGLILSAGEWGARDLRSTLATKLFETVYTSLGGPGSDLHLQDLNNLAKGEGDDALYDTETDLFKAFHTRNVIRHINDQLTTASTTPKEGGDPLSAVLAKQVYYMPDSPEKRELVSALLTSPGDEQRGELREGFRFNRITGTLSPEVGIQLKRGWDRLIRSTIQIGSHYTDLIESQPAMRGYNAEQGFNNRYMDALVGSYMSDQEDGDAMSQEAVRRMREQAYQGASPEQRKKALLETGGEAPEGFDLGEAQLKESIKLSPLQAAAEMYARHANRPEFVSSLFTAQLEDQPPTMVPVTEDDLRRNMEMYSRNDKRMEAEMRRRREAYQKKSPQLQADQPTEGQPPNQQGQQGAPPPQQGQPPQMGGAFGMGKQ